MNFKEMFQKQIEDILYIELDDIAGDKQLYNKIKAIPIRSNKFLQGVKDGTYSKTIGFEDIVDGMIYTIGGDKDFKYKDNYLGLLMPNRSEVLSVINKNIIYAEENKEYEDVFIYTNGLIEIGIDVDIVFFKRANALENIYNERFNTLKEEEKEEILSFVIKEYEKLDMPWAYYRLGYIYMGLERYVKSRLYFERYLARSDQEDLKEEVRQVLDELDNFSKVEAAQTYIEYGDFSKALNNLHGVDNRYPQREYLNYLLGFCENKLGNHLIAQSHLESALNNSEGLREEYFNELSMTYVSLGDYERAIETYTKGIEIFINSYTLIYNRGVLFYNNNDYLSALNDFERAYELNPNEDLTMLIDSIKNNHIK